ncbi:MAG TPA: hypothetical protein VID27_03205 [Blastocatellia bacterium]
MQDRFEKDFSYLMPFIDRVSTAAREISDGRAREELTRLVSDERARWSRIRQLLSGTVEAQENTDQTTTTESEPRFQFTVGSLRRREQ